MSRVVTPIFYLGIKVRILLRAYTSAIFDTHNYLSCPLFLSFSSFFFHSIAHNTHAISFLDVSCSHASVRRNFADDIKGVLSGFNSSPLNGDGGKAAEAPVVAPAAVGTVWRDEKVKQTYCAISECF